MSKPDDAELTIIIVNYHSEDFLRECLPSIKEASSTSPRVCIIDNGSSPGKIDELRSEFPGVEWILPDGNIGYSAANNLVLRNSEARYVLLLNPDVVLSKGSVDRLVEGMESHPNVGILGCMLLYTDGTVQQGPGEGDPYVQNGIEPLDWPFVLGACMLVRGTTLEKCGIMDENLFLFHEDVEYCHRVRHAGWRVCLMPDVCVRHYGGSSYAGLDFMAVERQRAVSFIIYCKRCLPLGQRFWKLWNYSANALWCSFWYTCSSLDGNPRRLKKKQMYLARLQALGLSCLKRRKVL